MTVQLPEHDHCKFCGDPVEFEKAYCSMECYHAEQARIKKEKMRDLAFCAVAGVGIVVIVAASFLLK